MIRNIEIIDEEVRNILLFKEVEGIKPLNILFGGNYYLINGKHNNIR